MQYFFFFLFFSSHLMALINLDEWEQPFILETKRIHIPGYPDAFNPSIVVFQNRVLMSFRTRNPSTKQATLVGFTWLDTKLNPVGTPQILKVMDKGNPCKHIQDPRLIVIQNKLYMAYSDLLEDPETKALKRTMCMAEIIYDGVRFFAVNRDFYLNFSGNKFNKIEKNWVPFDYKGLLMLAYSLIPHKVFLPIQGENRCFTIANNQESHSWKWGTLRGGTTALQMDNQYLAFFHSSTGIASVQSEGEKIVHYFMGAYTFDSQPPFAIKKISPKPIVSKAFYNGEKYNTWKPLRVVFPCGFIHDKDYIWISYGRQDFEAWLVKLDKAKLLSSLIPF